MTWTCDKEDDCENGEDETHCSERQGGESTGVQPMAGGGGHTGGVAGPCLISDIPLPSTRLQILPPLGSYCTSWGL